MGNKYYTDHGHQVGGKKTAEYTVWDHMMQRCYNPNNPEFKNYGDRGIKVHEPWHKFEEFIADVGLKPEGGRRISFGRIDNDGDYKPGNVEWQTPAKQSRNRRTTKLTMVDAREIRMFHDRGWSPKELAKSFGVSQRNIRGIIKNEYWKEDS
jgi:hypothetical protein